MAAAAHDPAFAKKVGVPVKVAKEFNQADTGGAMLGARRSTSGGTSTAYNESAAEHRAHRKGR